MTGPFASLPIYDLPELAPANAALWQAVATGLRREGVTGVPDRLDAGPQPLGPATLLTQTCGYPLQTLHRERFQLLAVPSYDAPGCGDGTHRAFVVVRQTSPARSLEDLRGGVFAVNDAHSNTGMNLPRALFAPMAAGRAMFARVVETGSHVASMARVTAGGADAASIDCVTYAFVRQYRPDAVAGLRVLAETRPSPAIPFVTAATTPASTVVALRKTLLGLATDPIGSTAMTGLRIRALHAALPEAYDRLLDHEREAAAQGYARLA